MDFTRAQQPSANIWGKRVKNVFAGYGLGVIPALIAARAHTNVEFSYEIMDYVEVAGFDVIFPEVVPWPYSEDIAGVAFDQSSLYGVRTRCWRRPMSDGGGDMEYYTAVPKGLPSGYTSVGRSNLIYIFGDFIGPTPMINMTPWTHRTPTGFIPDITTDIGVARSIWYPMNRNDEVLEVTYASGIIEGDDDQYYFVSALADPHVGFRGGKVRATISNPGGPYPITSSQDYKIACLPLNASWEGGSPGASGVEDLSEFTLSHTFAGSGEPAHYQEVMLDPSLPDDTGIAKRFIIYSGPYDSGTSYDLVSGSIDLQMSPRTDVPLPFFCSQQNRCAPGGIILP